MSARTGGSILLQLLFDLARPGHQVDRVLKGPTNDVWIDPWLAHLRSLGVDYRTEHQVQAIHTAGQAVSRVEHRGRRAHRGGHGRLLRRRRAGRGDAHARDRRDEAGRPTARRAQPPAHSLDERGDVLSRSRRTAWSTGTASTSTRRGRSPRSRSASSGPGSTSAGWATGGLRASSPSTSPTGRRRGEQRQAGHVLLERGGVPTRSGPSSSGASTMPGSICWRTRTCSTAFLDPDIVYPNPTAAGEP